MGDDGSINQISGRDLVESGSYVSDFQILCKSGARGPFGYMCFVREPDVVLVSVYNL